MSEQMTLIVYEIPEFVPCEIHGDFNPQAYYTESQIIQMLDDDGDIECPMCLAEIAGIES